MKKLTKKEVLTAIMTLASTGTCPIDAELVSDFCEKEIAALDRKATKARERAAQKRTEPDALRDAIIDVLTDDWMTVNQIMDALPDDLLEVSANRVVYRLTQLCAPEAGIAKKDKQSFGEAGAKRSLTVYARA